MNKDSYKKLLLKKGKEAITCLTAYSFPFAKILDGLVDLILIGDSVGTTIYGMKNTRNVSLAVMKNHAKAVVKISNLSMTIVDMPYNTYKTKKESLKNALDILKFTKADFVKIETDIRNVEIVKFLSDNNIDVVSHIGVNPQKFSDFRKIRSVGKNLNEINKLVKLAIKLEEAGSKLIVLECVTIAASKLITKKLSIPTIGIGSSKYCDGQVLVIDDMLNFDSDFKKPKYVKKYMNVEREIKKAVQKFVYDVKNKKFPSNKNSYK